MISTETKIKQLMQSSKIDKKTREILDDMMKKKNVHGNFTLGQIKWVDKVYNNIFPSPADPIERACQEYENNKCKACDDNGIVEAIMDGIETLLLCGCDASRIQPWDLPTIAEAPDVRTKHVNWREFMPKIANPTPNHPAVRERIAWWKERVATAEEFWRNHTKS